MIINKITIGTLHAPLKTPFKTALRTVDAVNDIILILETDTGQKGYGEAPATQVITGDTLVSIAGAIEFLSPYLLGQDINNFNQIIYNIQNKIVHNNSAKAAIEIALYDLLAQARQVPLYQLLGGGEINIITDCTISLNQIDEMLEDCQKAIDEGFDCLKIKVGGEIKTDYLRIDSIMQNFADKVSIRIDANQAWEAKPAVWLMQQLENKGYEFDFVEQPTKAHDITGMKWVRDNINTPVLADEAVFSFADALHILQTDSADIINIKLMKTAGISEAIKIANITQEYNKTCMLGCMLESMISVTAAAHLASAYSHVITRIDLDGPVLCKSIPVIGGLKIDNKHIVLSSEYGLGIKEVTEFETQKVLSL